MTINLVIWGNSYRGLNPYNTREVNVNKDVLKNRENVKRWRLAHPDRKSEVNKEYYLKNRDKKLAYCREWLKTEHGRRSQLESFYRAKKKYPEKVKARSLLIRAIKSGKLKRLPCEVCGIEKSEGHHKDYSKPLDVEWLCSYHHRLKEGRISFDVLNEPINTGKVSQDAKA